MHKLVIDLEMAGKKWVDEERHIREIIQIGAVLLNDNNEQIVTFEKLVKPVYCTVTKRIENLTGLTNEMLDNELEFEEAIKQMLDILPKDEDVQLLTWSDSDTIAILNEMEIKNINNDKLKSLCENYIDIQKEFSKKLNFESILNLEKALNLVGIDFEGKAHGALVDAINTAKLYTMVANGTVQENIDRISSVMECKPLTNSLGSMFDFSKFNFE